MRGARLFSSNISGKRPMREEGEGSKVTIPTGYAPDDYRLVGKISGEAPKSGPIRQRPGTVGSYRSGWWDGRRDDPDDTDRDPERVPKHRHPASERITPPTPSGDHHPRHPASRVKSP